MQTAQHVCHTHILARLFKKKKTGRTRPSRTKISNFRSSTGKGKRLDERRTLKTSHLSSDLRQRRFGSPGSGVGDHRRDARARRPRPQSSRLQHLHQACHNYKCICYIINMYSISSKQH